MRKDTARDTAQHDGHPMSHVRESSPLPRPIPLTPVHHKGTYLSTETICETDEWDDDGTFMNQMVFVVSAPCETLASKEVKPASHAYSALCQLKVDTALYPQQHPFFSAGAAPCVTLTMPCPPPGRGCGVFLGNFRAMATNSSFTLVAVFALVSMKKIPLSLA